MNDRDRELLRLIIQNAANVSDGIERFQIDYERFVSDICRLAKIPKNSPKN